MKYMLNIIAVLFPLWCSASPLLSHKTVTYILDEAVNNPNALTIEVERSYPLNNTKLILEGKKRGIVSQVEHLTCDGDELKEGKAGEWAVPIGCRNIKWQVPLQQSKMIANTQQSAKFHNTILFSESSSLPRLIDTKHENIKIKVKNIRSIYPQPNTSNVIALPHAHSAPLFILINIDLANNYSSGIFNIRYFIDYKENKYLLPDILQHAKGIEWLKKTTNNQLYNNFNIAWLGVSLNQLDLGGAASQDILLANYTVDGETPYGKSTLLYISLHEAFHQLTEKTNIPTWVAESLAGYYGMQALLHIDEHDANSIRLMGRFLASSAAFKNGLLTIDRHVQEGDRSEYAAFYTKGIAFWLAVNNALQTNNDSLNAHLSEIIHLNFDNNDALNNLQHILNLPRDVWNILYQQYLE